MSVLLRNLLVAVLLTNAGPAPAESVRELDRAELRKIVTSGGIISLKKAVAAVAARAALTDEAAVIDAVAEVKELLDSNMWNYHSLTARNVTEAEQ